MKFNLTKQDKEKLYNLFDQREYNIYMATLIMDLINSNQRYFKGIKEQDMFEEFCKRLDGDDEYEWLYDYHFPKGLIKLDDKHYKDNPYYQNIKIDKNIKFGDYTLGYETYKPYEVFIADDYFIDEDHYFAEVPKMSYFENTHKFLAVKQNNVIWMSITPAETDTMIEHIKKIHGKVITFGLGLGYIQYMLALKEDVSDVYIVDKDPVIIDMFSKNILPQFKEVGKKIHIIQDDAYNQMKQLDKYDCVYVDLWHNPNDGLMFYKDFKKIEKAFPNQEFYYWLEEGIIALIRRCLISLLFEQFELKYKPENYINQKDSDETDKLINSFYHLLKKKEFNSYDDIHKLLTKESIKELMTLLS